MPSEESHIAFANRTQKTIACLLSDKEVHSPWIATTAFYKAVHIVEAIFSRDATFGHSSNHDEREGILKRHRKFEHVYKYYSRLRRASQNARYLANCDNFDTYLAPDDVIQQLLRDSLNQIERSASKQLSKGADLHRITDII